MIVVHESKQAYELSKPIICKKCDRGKLGSISVSSVAMLSKRGKPPTDKSGDYLQVKCPTCRSFWVLTMESSKTEASRYCG